MKPQLKIELSLTMLMALLSACSPMAAYAEVPPPTPAPTFAADVEPDASDQEVEAVSNEESAAQDVETVNVIDQLVNAYLSGEIDNVGDLSSQELAEFSSKLAEKKNAERGINPIIYDDGTGNPAYINPENYMLMNYDGHPDMDETIQMFVPIAGKDEQGNLQFEVDGQIVTIPGSADEDWNMVISDINDTRIEWPKTKLLSTGLTSAENKTAKFGVVLTPMILLDKNLGQLYLGGAKPLMQSTLRFLQIETDQAGHPLLARKIITHGTFYYLYKEGSDLDIRSNSGPIPTDSDFYKALLANTIYYIGFDPEVEKNYITMEDSIDGYSGAVVDDTTFKIIFGEVENDKDMVIIPAFTLMMKSTD